MKQAKKNTLLDDFKEMEQHNNVQKQEMESTESNIENNFDTESEYKSKRTEIIKENPPSKKKIPTTTF